MSAGGFELSPRFRHKMEAREMTPTATAHSRLASLRPSRRMRRLGAPPTPGLTLRPGSLPALAVVLGLATGLLELFVHFLRRRFINPSSFGALQLNPHAFWMVPISGRLDLWGLWCDSGRRGRRNPQAMGFTGRCVRTSFSGGLRGPDNLPGAGLSRLPGPRGRYLGPGHVANLLAPAFPRPDHPFRPADSGRARRGIGLREIRP